MIASVVNRVSCTLRCRAKEQLCNGASRVCLRDYCSCKLLASSNRSTSDVPAAWPSSSNTPNVCHARRLSLSSCHFKKPGKPSGYMKSQSLQTYSRKFLGGNVAEPELVYNVETGQPKKKIKQAYLCSGTSQRRLLVLNKIFFDNIRDVMSSDAFAHHLIGCDLHVTKVRVLEKMLGIHVHYLQTGNGPEPSPELLKNVGRVLRKELHNLALSSFIPPISFKKDTEFENVVEVERRLAIITQTEQQQRQQSELESVHQIRLAAPPVPDEIFEDDFKYDPSSPLSFAAASAQLSNPKMKPRSSFTPFSRARKMRTEENALHPSWNRPAKVQWVGSVPDRSAPRQVTLATNTFNLNRAAVMARVEFGLSRVIAFKNDGIDIKVYEANMVDFSLDRKLLQGEDVEQQQRWQPVLDIMPRSSLERWATDYSRKRLHQRGDKIQDLKAGESSLAGLGRDDHFDDRKYYNIENELWERTDAPDLFEDESCR